MPRSNRPRRPAAAAGKYAERPAMDLERARFGIPERESAPDGEWAVRTITASNAAKTYTCPGCHRQVLPGVAHLVVWSEDNIFGADAGLRERRHWHTNCWRTRSFRYR
ncbi:ATP/GTP-binding protein [Pseudarthrobacter sp. P1]|uniref:ATP/GTP-binding protein n=1 Tax=Pseudarthrobacter sp. P1 TaxID=3418418 RepID=UPI003CFBA06D